MNALINAKIDRDFRLLSKVQQKMVVMYGFRQIKYMIEKDFSSAEKNIPVGSVVQGVNGFGRWQSINIEEQKRYVYFPTKDEWSQAVEFFGGGDVDSLLDIQHIYKLFNLKKFTLEDLFEMTTPLIEMVSEKIMKTN